MNKIHHNRFKELREKAGYTQMQVAKLIGFSTKNRIVHIKTTVI